MTYLQNNISTPSGATASSVLPTTARRRLRAALVKLVGPKDCQRLLDSAGETGILRWPASHLAAASGVTQRSADRVVAARELRPEKLDSSAPVVTCAADVLKHLPPGYATWETESVLVLALSASNRVQAVLLIAQGGGSSAALVPHDLFTPLVRFRAVAFVVVHNHPSGDSTPSEADVRLTNRLAAGGHILSIQMIDHIIVASGGATSLSEMGLLPTHDEIRQLNHADRPF